VSADHGVEPPVVFLMGPTGSGKSRLALALAERVPLEIVSVDSAQVYRGLDVGTAKPNPAVRRRVPHHLIDVCDPSASYSAARFRADASTAIEAIRARGRLPLLVGGTGLYFRALERGLAALPAADDDLRRALATELARDGSEALHARLAQVDAAAAARIHPRDPQRVLRALEVHAQTGRPLTALWRERRLAPLAPPPLKLALAPRARAVLHRRLEQRFHDMLDRGLVNEVRALRARGDLTAASPALRSVGYREVWRYLEGELGWEEMVTRALAATRQLAKRQLTWLRREPGVAWLEGEHDAALAAVGDALRVRGILKAREYGLE
jgi:tRNA dimethylallyltransferase